MSTTDVLNDPVAAAPDEMPRIQRLREALSGVEPEGQVRHFLADSQSLQVEIPPSVFRVLLGVVRAMAVGQSVAIVHYDHELTTQQAADLLQVSRPHLIRLLEEGKMRYRMVGTHRRIRMGDLLSYRSQRDRMRRENLKELRRVSEDLGLYEKDLTPE